MAQTLGLRAYDTKESKDGKEDDVNREILRREEVERGTNKTLALKLERVHLRGLTLLPSWRPSRFLFFSRLPFLRDLSMQVVENDVSVHASLFAILHTCKNLWRISIKVERSPEHPTSTVPKPNATSRQSRNISGDSTSGRCPSLARISVRAYGRTTLLQTVWYKTVMRVFLEDFDLPRLTRINVCSLTPAEIFGDQTRTLEKSKQQTSTDNSGRLCNLSRVRQLHVDIDCGTYNPNLWLSFVSTCMKQLTHFSLWSNRKRHSHTIDLTRMSQVLGECRWMQVFDVYWSPPLPRSRSSSSSSSSAPSSSIPSSASNMVRRAVGNLRKGAPFFQQVFFPFTATFVERLVRGPPLYRLNELSLRGNVLDASSLIRLMDVCPNLWRLCTNISPTITLQVCIDVLQWRSGKIAEQERNEKNECHPRCHTRASLLWEIEHTAAVLHPTWWERDRHRQILILAKQARVKFIEQ
jgi:hypothetical protein